MPDVKKKKFPAPDKSIFERSSLEDNQCAM